MIRDWPRKGRPEFISRPRNTAQVIKIVTDVLLLNVQCMGITFSTLVSHFSYNHELGGVISPGEFAGTCSIGI